MRATLAILAVIVVGAGPGCKSVDCGPGTFERDGLCVPADDIASPATCGPFTELVAGQCVPQFPPMVCDDTSTTDELDTSTGVVTCIGTGSGFACEQPDAGKQTICGQLHDLETGMPFTDGNASCTPCTTTTATGVCSLGLRAVDAIKFAMNPQDPTAVLVTDPLVLDDCGRFKIPNITLPISSPFIGIGIDDANPAMAGPAGTTNAIGMATPKVANLALKQFEAFVAPASTTAQWETDGPEVADGVFVAIFRAGRTGLAGQAGVTILREGAPIPGDDHYFQGAPRTAIANNATATSANGTALVENATLDGYIGAGSLPPECVYEGHAGVSLPNVLFIQIFRPTDAAGMTCGL